MRSVLPNGKAHTGALAAQALAQRVRPGVRSRLHEKEQLSSPLKALHRMVHGARSGAF